ncbi:hypothetical protein [Rhizosaccharibacter radicis]|uniref:Uncharacterized protein n=1 Tax=Rhizosaccharibacter radicis TaxID=2782605 RepID=A0ABT1VXX8_9PROT|nr:hypothetical protein [Acetobacteraceae bacterium KSS12]
MTTMTFNAGTLFNRAATAQLSRRPVSLRIPRVLRVREAVLPMVPHRDAVTEAGELAGRAALAMLPFSFLCWVFIAH